MKTLIRENEKGLLFRDGKFKRTLDAGRYHTFGNSSIEKLSIDSQIESENITVELLLKNEMAAAQAVVADVADEQLALHFVDGKFRSVLSYGRHAFWKAGGDHSFQMVDISEPEVGDDVPQYIFNRIPNVYYERAVVLEYQKGRLFYNGRFVRLLEPGTYYFWRGKTEVEVTVADTRLIQMNVTGQEIMTLDKVSLRINVICSYRITDYARVVTEIDDYEEQLHVAVQMALRAFVGRLRVDEILESKAEMGDFVFEYLKERENGLFIEVEEAGIKDLILPGDIRDIMNTVLIAEKQAQANVITRREEVASTRSLLNTARLMEENKTLYKLKEMEYIERICENVGNINVNGNGDLVAQLSGILTGER